MNLNILQLSVWFYGGQYNRRNNTGKRVCDWIFYTWYYICHNIIVKIIQDTDNVKIEIFYLKNDFHVH